MKKILIFLFIFILFVGCHQVYQTVSYEHNNTFKVVTYVVDNELVSSSGCIYEETITIDSSKETGEIKSLIYKEWSKAKSIAYILDYTGDKEEKQK